MAGLYRTIQVAREHERKEAVTKVDQTCPHCGITEAGGAYCTRCLARTETWWLHPPKRSEAQRATTAFAGAHRSKESAGPEVSQ
jgi:methionyl-tRNA synthetase